MDPLVFQQAVLSSGATAIWQDSRDVDYVMLGGFVRVGSINDPLGKDGLAHLFEHLPFEATSMLPTNLVLAMQVERHGGTVNAATAPDMTMFFLSMPVWKSRDAWLVLASMLFEPRPTPDILNGQVNDVINEMASFANDVPTRQNVDRENARMFGREFGRRARVIGWPTSLRRISLNDVQSFHQQHYHPANMVFLATGNLKEFGPDWPTFLEQHLPASPPNQPTPWPRCALSPASRPGQWVTPRHDDLVPRLTIGARIHFPLGLTMDEYRRQQRTCGVVQRLLNGGQSSLIYQRIREDSTLSYDGVSDVSYLMPGAATWDFTGTTRTNDDLVELVTSVGNILAHPERIGQIDVDYAKEGLLGSWAVEDFGPSTAFMWATRFMSEGYPIPSRQEWCDQLDRVTLKDVRDLITRDLHPRRWVTVCYEPV